MKFIKNARSDTDWRFFLKHSQTTEAATIGVLYKKSVLKHFAKFTEKQFALVSFFNKLLC